MAAARCMPVLLVALTRPMLRWCCASRGSWARRPTRSPPRRGPGQVPPTASCRAPLSSPSSPRYHRDRTCGQQRVIGRAPGGGRMQSTMQDTELLVSELLAHGERIHPHATVTHYLGTETDTISF